METKVKVIDRQALLDSAVKNGCYNPFEHMFAAYNAAVESGITNPDKAHDFAVCALVGIEYDMDQNTACLPADVPRIAMIGRRFATCNSNDTNTDTDTDTDTDEIDYYMSVVPATSSDRAFMSMSEDGTDKDNFDFMDTNPIKSSLLASTAVVAPHKDNELSAHMPFG